MWQKGKRHIFQVMASKQQKGYMSMQQIIVYVDSLTSSDIAETTACTHAECPTMTHAHTQIRVVVVVVVVVVVADVSNNGLRLLRQKRPISSIWVACSKKAPMRAARVSCLFSNTVTVVCIQCPCKVKAVRPPPQLRTVYLRDGRVTTVDRCVEIGACSNCSTPEARTKCFKKAECTTVRTRIR